jgi:acetyltransferase
VAEVVHVTPADLDALLVDDWRIMANGGDTGELRGGIGPLLFPRSVAIVGASPRVPEPIHSVVRGGVPAWGVHPRHREVDGLACVPSFADLPEEPELALLLVGHASVEQAFEEALAAGVRAFVVPGLGNEAGPEGPRVAARIAARAAEAGAAIVGPNCMGVAVPDGPSPWIGIVPDAFVRGRVGIVAQSGSVAEACLALPGRVGFRCVVSSGGEIARDAADLVGFLAEDDGTAAIGLFVETVRRPAAFAEALGRCADAGKPVVCLKVGRSEAGARVALAHTGALVGSDRAFSAVLAAYGAIRVDDFPDLVETLEALGRRRRPRGTRIGAVSESGGEAALFADHAEAAGLPFGPLPEELAAALQAEFPNYVAPGNPLDAWAVDDPERVYPRSLELMARSGAFDILVAQVDDSRYRADTGQDWCGPAVAALADAAEGAELYPVVATVHGVDVPPELQALATARDLPILRGLGAAARALAAATAWRARRPPAVGAEPVDLGDLLDGDGALPELESARIVERYGVPVVPSVRASSPEEAARAAAELGPPVVVKVDGVAHKAAAGGVALGLETPEEAAEAARRLGGRVLVARQLPPGTEAFCGVTRDPDFGPILAVGRGGVDVEEHAVGAARLAPVDLEGARELVAAAGLTQGVDDLARTLVALGRIAFEHPSVAAVDVNPLILREDGATAVDALVVVDKAAPV